MKFNDVKHDTDSCLDVWNDFYCKVYRNFFGQYFDFEKIEDKETSSKCKRWYIKLRDDFEKKQMFPKFKMAGDCIFNFNHKKVEILKKYLQTEEDMDLLKYCLEYHHSFENFSFMPITGGMNVQKGRNRLDRPDVHLREIEKHFNCEKSNVFNNARGNKEALEWYFSLFENDIVKYMNEVYLINDENFIKEFLEFSNVEVNNREAVIKYMNLAKMFWSERKIVISK